MRQTQNFATAVSSSVVNTSPASLFAALTNNVISFQSMLHITSGFLALRMIHTVAKNFGYAHFDELKPGENRFNPLVWYSKLHNLTTEELKAFNKGKTWFSADMMTGCLSACALGLAYYGRAFESVVSKYSTPLVIGAVVLWNAKPIIAHACSTSVAIKDYIYDIIWVPAKGAATKLTKQEVTAIEDAGKKKHVANVTQTVNSKLPDLNNAAGEVNGIKHYSAEATAEILNAAIGTESFIVTDQGINFRS